MKVTTFKPLKLCKNRTDREYVTVDIAELEARVLSAYEREDLKALVVTAPHGIGMMQPYWYTK